MFFQKRTHSPHAPPRTTVRGVPSACLDHYATLGLGRRCTDAEIRAAYRLLSKQHHPDVNAGCANAAARTRDLNAAYETLSNPALRRAHDRELDRANSPAAPARAAKIGRNISQDAHLRIEELLLGTSLDVRVNDPASESGPEIYRLTIPPDTAPGTRFRLPRNDDAGGGFVSVRVKARADFRFKVRGTDLRCDLRITPQRAAQGGTESVRDAAGNFLRVQIPAKVPRGETLRITGGGLPKPRGGCGDLLVRIMYRPEVRISRAGRG